MRKRVFPTIFLDASTRTKKKRIIVFFSLLLESVLSRGQEREPGMYTLVQAHCPLSGYELSIKDCFY